MIKTYSTLVEITKADGSTRVIGETVIIEKGYSDLGDIPSMLAIRYGVDPEGVTILSAQLVR